MATATETPKQTDAEYHSDFSRISNSMLADFIASRRLFEARYVTKTEPTKSSTKPMDVGSIIHAVLLDQRPLRSVVGIYPDYDPRISDLKKMTGPSRDKLSSKQKASMCDLLKIDVATFDDLKPGKQLQEFIAERLPLQPLRSDGGLSQPDASRFEAEQKLKRLDYCVKRSDYEQIKLVINAVRRDSIYQTIDYENTLREHALFWTNDAGQDCRCKVDFLIPMKDRIFVVDLKVTAFVSPDAWANQVNNNKRLVTQTAHYTDGVLANFPQYESIEQVVWRWVTVSPESPVTAGSVCRHALDEDDFLSAVSYYEYQMESLRKCYETGDWSEIYEGEDNVLELKPWAFG